MSADSAPAGATATEPAPSPVAGKFPTPPELFTIQTLGGWSAVDKKFFDASNGEITKIEQEAGVPTVSS